MTANYVDCDEAKEMAKRIVPGILKVVKAFCPTVDGADGKKAHLDATILDGVLYVGSDRSPCLSEVELRPHEYAKKKSRLRQDLAPGGPGGSLSATLNYGAASLWLKAHADNVGSASYGPDGLSLAVGTLVRHRMTVTPGGEAYARGIRDTIASRVGPVVAGPFPLPALRPEQPVLALTEDEATTAPTLVSGAGLIQLRIRTEMLPKGDDVTVAAHRDTLGELVMVVQTVAPEYTARQYFRVLEL